MSPTKFYHVIQIRRGGGFFAPPPPLSWIGLIECNDNYSKTSGSLWQYCKDIPAVDNNGKFADFNGANATDSFNSKAKITGQTNNGGEIDNVETMVPLKYLINFWRTLEMPLINCEVNLTSTWSANWVIM